MSSQLVTWMHQWRDVAGLKQAVCCVQSGWGYAAATSGGAGYTGGLDGLGLDPEEESGSETEDSEDSEEE